ELHIHAPGEDRRPGLPRQAADGGGPRRVLEEVAGDGRLGPEDESRVAFRLERPGHPHELGDHAIGMAGVPLLPEALVGLDQAHGPDLADRKRAYAPGAMRPSGDHGREHRDSRTPPAGTAPRSALPHRPLHDHRIAPRQPERHPARARDVGPLHERRRVGERCAEAQPGEADVALMTPGPLDRRPGDRKYHPQRYGRKVEAHARHEPEEQRMPQAEEHDRREIAERRQRREVPERDHQPVEHGALGHEAVPEPPAEGAARVPRLLEATEQDDGRHDGGEAHYREGKRRVAGGKERGAHHDESRRPPGGTHHRSTSRPSSAERYTASSTRWSASWSRGGGALTSPRITARKYVHSARYDCANGVSRPVAPVGVTSVTLPWSSLNTRNGCTLAEPLVPTRSNQKRS